MRKLIFLTIFSFLVIGLFSSCSGCVKKASKKVTETGLDILEGAAEAIDEQGTRIGEKTTDAAGKLAEGVGRSLDRQLNEHAEKVASVGGRTLVQSVDGFTQGFNAEMKTLYDALPYTDNFCSGVSLDYFAKYKTIPIVDAYFVIMEKGTYECKFQCINKSGKLFLTKDAKIEKASVERKYSLVSFALNPEEEKEFGDIQNVKIIVTKK